MSAPDSYSVMARMLGQGCIVPPEGPKRAYEGMTLYDSVEMVDGKLQDVRPQVVGTEGLAGATDRPEAVKALADAIGSHIVGRAFRARPTSAGEGQGVLLPSDQDPTAKTVETDKICDGEFAGPNACVCGDPESHAGLWDVVAKTVHTEKPDEQWRKAVLDNADKQCEAIDNGYRCSTITDLEAIPLKPGTRRPE
jgi:hypothetical protein